MVSLKNKMNFATILLFVSFLLAGGVSADVYEIDKNHSTIGFVTTHLTVSKVITLGSPYLLPALIPCSSPSLIKFPEERLALLAISALIPAMVLSRLGT